MVGVGGTSNYLPVMSGGEQVVPLDQQAVPTSFRWASVTGVDPLRIQFDGESAELPMTPETLASPLAVGNRVWVQLIGHRVIIIGTGNSTSGVPPGSVIMFAGTAVLDGYLRCDGAAVSRSTYPLLFAAIGTVYGGGNGSTTFNVPNFTNRFPVGYAPGSTGGADAVTLSTTQMPSHSHTSPAHVHDELPHTHSGGSHSHTTDSHGHTTNTHAHEQGVGALGGGVPGRGDWVGDGSVTRYPQGILTSFNGVTVNASGVTVNPASITVGESGVAIDWATVTINSTGGGGSHENRPPYLGVGFLIKY